MLFKLLFGQVASISSPTPEAVSESIGFSSRDFRTTNLQSVFCYIKVMLYTGILRSLDIYLFVLGKCDFFHAKLQGINQWSRVSRQ